MKPEINRCEKCGRVLDNNKIVWLELSNTDGNYYKEISYGHISQGGFPFGEACAIQELKDTERKNCL